MSETTDRSPEHEAAVNLERAARSLALSIAIASNREAVQLAALRGIWDMVNRETPTYLPTLPEGIRPMDVAGAVARSLGDGT